MHQDINFDHLQLVSSSELVLGAIYCKQITATLAVVTKLYGFDTVKACLVAYILNKYLVWKYRVIWYLVWKYRVIWKLAFMCNVFLCSYVVFNITDNDVLSRVFCGSFR